MQRLTDRSHRDRGVTMISFAILLMGILGLVGLGIDAGAVFAKRQHVQNGADAAAFALAQEYAPDCPTDAAMALDYAKRNIPNQTDDVTVGLLDCDDNSLTVTIHGEQQPFFLGAVGVTDIDVPATAVVEWGSPIAGSGIPLTFAECVFESGPAQDGDLIEIWVPQEEAWKASDLSHPDNPCKDESYTSAYPPGGFGWLDTFAPCLAKISPVDDGGFEAGGDTGNKDKTECDWNTVVGTTALIPVFAEAEGQGANAVYTISKFAAFELLGVQIHQGSTRYAAPGVDKNGPWCKKEPNYGKWKKHCVYGRFVEYRGIGDYDIGPVTDPDTLVIRLQSPWSS